MANLTDADKVLRNDTGKDIVTQLTAIKTAIENGGGGGGSGASTVSQLTDVLLSQNIPDGDVLVRDNNLTGGKLWKNATITVELTQAEYNQLVADDDVLPDVNYYITDAPSMQGTSADLSYDGTTKSTYTKISEIDTELSGKANTSDLPIWIKQASGTSVSFAVPCTFFFYYADQWRAYVQFPFIAKNNNYTLSNITCQAENIGDISSKISVIAKYGACFEIETTKTMTALPNQFSVCVGTVNFTITFT